MAQLPELVQALLKPSAYPIPPQKIKMIQTQMSFVFVADDLVYKVKKPVNLGYLDYTTLEKRLACCNKELELNRRLSPGVYLSVVPVTKSNHGILLEGQGETLEYAVKMRRLPAEKMMDVLLAHDGVTMEMVSQVAKALADFHQKAATNAEISAFGAVDTIKVSTDENFSQTENVIGRTISPEQHRQIKKYTDAFLTENTPLFLKRVAGGRIKDCHGDIHAAHVCFYQGVSIYDCIEFNDRFRYIDVASEVAFLAMDLDHYGRADLSRQLIRSYIEFSQDTEVQTLLRFYKCYRAYVRGKVEGFKLADLYISAADKEKITGVARSYFDLATAYSRPKPWLFITVGLVGTGKSTLARALAKRTGAVVISSDIVRKELAAVPLTEHHLNGFDTGIYTPEFTRKTYDELFARARNILSEGDSVILDASFIRSGERVQARETAQNAGAVFLVIECALPDGVIKERLALRQKQASVSDGRWEILAPQKQKYEKVTEVPSGQYLKLDMTQPLAHNLSAVLEKYLI